MRIWAMGWLLVLGATLATAAQAVNLDPRGLGQALVYPYYTVNGQQQTLLSVTNTSSQPKVARLRFREGYNGRSVLELNLWLSPYDVWTATIFALADAGLAGSGAALMSSDRSCTTPRLLTDSGAINGQPYVAFGDAAFTGSLADGGPSDLARTREGWMEVIVMADVPLRTPLSNAIVHNASGAPSNCALVQHVAADNPDLIAPSGGLMGTSSIINVGQGSILASRAEALAGFTGVKLFSAPGSALPDLSSVNDGADSSTATARVFDSAGRLHTLTYGNGIGRPIDAVSAVFTSQIHNEYVISPSTAANSDWVVTLPTKPHYTDPLLIGSSVVALPPFDEVFGEYEAGRSRVLGVRTNLFDRHQRNEVYSVCGFFCEPFNAFRTVANVLSITDIQFASWSSVLGSLLFARVPPVVGREGWLNLEFGNTPAHALPVSSEGKVMRGLPLIGFWATNLVNNAVSNGVLSNYSMAVRHAATVVCVKASDGTACN